MQQSFPSRQDYIGKHEHINIYEIPSASFKEYFHGELWVSCPTCGQNYQLVGRQPDFTAEGWNIYKCECGKVFKV